MKNWKEFESKLVLAARAGARSAESKIEPFWRSKPVQAVVLGASLALLIVSGFVFLASLCGLMIASIFVYLVLEKVLGLKIIPPAFRA